jgi:hypothetical protein
VTLEETLVVFISFTCCPFCENLHNQEISFEEALKEQYLASKDCTGQRGCSCCYGYRGLRDSNGKLIKSVNN